MGNEGNQLTALWEQSRSAVFACLIAEVGSFQEAEDLLQEVAVAVAAGYAKYDPQRPFLAWALGIARNQALMYHRRRRRDRLAFGEEMMKLVQAHLAQPPAADADNRLEALNACLAKLTDDQRAVIRLRYAGGLTLNDIAEQRDKSIMAVKGQLHRVRKMLRDCIQHRVART